MAKEEQSKDVSERAHHRQIDRERETERQTDKRTTHHSGSGSSLTLPVSSLSRSLTHTQRPASSRGDERRRRGADGLAGLVWPGQVRFKLELGSIEQNRPGLSVDGGRGRGWLKDGSSEDHSKLQGHGGRVKQVGVRSRGTWYFVAVSGTLLSRGTWDVRVENRTWSRIVHIRAGF